MELSNKQKEHLGKFFSDIAKTIITIFVIGGLIPATNIPTGYITIGLFTAILFLIAGLLLINGDIP